MIQASHLYIVATPIGNLKDISARALDVLAGVDLVAAEDTRVAKRLLSEYEIEAQCIAYHDHNESTQSDNLITKLQAGQSIALVSDAGTPLINDPGYTIVKKCRELGIKVVPIPGSCALIAALSAAGVATDQFYYGGFLPAKTKARCDVLSLLAERSYSSVFYESPHRILASLADVQKTLGDKRQIVIAREITKTFETIKGGAVADVIDWMQADHNQQKGEFVLIVEGVASSGQLDDRAKQLLESLIEHLPLKVASGIVAQTFDLKKKQVYEYGITLSDK
ncbi:16S rRNA (cytidine(1402)-2'-O)-methyltransferase [Catenovulum sp. SM1970]|uniref:16S rRNA (cytidine(1402)-2'-O)-methyltransferase n=1 Tax=Marinifaba aquimaris TaxID=2741323 RepID=UPI001572F5D9|nr:16S rRNA (cytidine(1402)-2'-O)-methyltransferase [Marinifaba aquimaris]NTS76605.1 16S rRNA (cytidine(1402)-2'-O)-methyltransferase [Marinifaba aquimaris]